jgi:hypothetical protein
MRMVQDSYDWETAMERVAIDSAWMHDPGAHRKGRSAMTHQEMQIVVAAILATGGLNATGLDQNPEQMVARYKAVLAELQKRQGVPPLRP